MKTAAAAIMLAASLTGIVVPAAAHADCGDPGQDPCTGPVPTVDQVVAIMQQLTDPNIPAVNKVNVITPPFTALALVAVNNLYAASTSAWRVRNDAKHRR
jgi:hypothetical protein